jgi:hypothetical protein
MAMVTRRHLGRCLRTILRWVAAAAGLAFAVAGTRLVLGMWATAVVLALLVVVGLIVGWAAVEARAFDRGRPDVAGRGAGLSRADHLAFARALAVVAEAYLAQCEREARP